MGHGDLFFKSRISRPHSIERQIGPKIQPRTAPERNLQKRGRLLCLLPSPVQGPGGVQRALHIFCDAAFEKEIPMALQSTISFFKTLKRYHSSILHKTITCPTPLSIYFCGYKDFNSALCWVQCAGQITSKSLNNSYSLNPCNPPTIA